MTRVPIGTENWGPPLNEDISGVEDLAEEALGEINGRLSAEAINTIALMAVEAKNAIDGRLSEASLLALFETISGASSKYAPVGSVFKALTRVPEVLMSGAIARNDAGVVTSAAVVWPDGAVGTFTTDTIGALGTIDAYHITHVVGSVTTTYTQPTITRDSSGLATNVPDVTVT